MSVPYDVFAGSFLAKISEYSFLSLEEADRTAMVDGFMKRALSGFRKNCQYDLFTTGNDDDRIFEIDIPEEDLTELADTEIIDITDEDEDEDFDDELDEYFDGAE